MTDRCRESLDELLEGNKRFRSGKTEHVDYSEVDFTKMAEGQAPIAAIITCSDSRVAPEIVFDQPLGKLFIARPPGNTPSESAKWMVDLAVNELDIPLIMVMGHTNCAAVAMIIDKQLSGPGGMLRLAISDAVNKAKANSPDDLYMESIKENARHTAQVMIKESSDLRKAIQEGTVAVVAAYYEIETGTVHLLGQETGTGP